MMISCRYTVAGPMNSTHATTRIEIEPEGDLCLQAGEGDYTTVFTVCSKSVARASRVLNKMLYGGFTESKELQSPNSEWIVKLPDDDPDSLQVSLNIVHSRFQQVSNFGARITPRRFYDLAILIDKYDLTHLLRPWVKDWLDAINRQSTLGSPSPSFLHERLWTAWVVGDQELFKLMARILVLESSPSRDNNTHTPVVLWRDNILDPPGIFDMIENTRLNTIAALFAFIQGIIDGLMSGDKRFCLKNPTHDNDYGACVPSMIGNIIRSLHFEGFWPTPEPSECDRSVLDVASRLKTLRMHGRDGSDHYCSYFASTQTAINGILDAAFVDLTDWQLHHLKIQGGKSGIIE